MQYYCTTDDIGTAANIDWVRSGSSLVEHIIRNVNRSNTFDYAYVPSSSWYSEYIKLKDLGDRYECTVPDYYMNDCSGISFYVNSLDVPELVLPSSKISLIDPFTLNLVLTQSEYNSLQVIERRYIDSVRQNNYKNVAKITGIRGFGRLGTQYTLSANLSAGDSSVSLSGAPNLPVGSMLLVGEEVIAIAGTNSISRALNYGSSAQTHASGSIAYAIDIPDDIKLACADLAISIEQRKNDANQSTEYKMPVLAEKVIRQYAEPIGNY